MQERNLDAVLVTGPAQHNPYMVYMTGGGHLTQADLIKRRGAADSSTDGRDEKPAWKPEPGDYRPMSCCW
jgi:Xaa-Pro aminopeptidase